MDAAANTGEDPLEEVVEVATVDTDEQSGQLQPQPGVPHSIVKGMKNLLAVAAVTDISFKEAETLKKFLEDPSKDEAAPATGGQGSGG